MTGGKGLCVAIVPAAGEGLRMGAPVRKAFLEIGGRPILFWTLEALASCNQISEIILALHPEDLPLAERFESTLSALRVSSVVGGGPSRPETVAIALEKVPARAALVAIHDAVRPMVRRELLDRVIAAARITGAAILAVPVGDTVKEAYARGTSGRADHAGVIKRTILRQRLWLAQTPQVFRRELIQKAYSLRRTTCLALTDDAQLVEAMGHPVSLVRGSPENVKITFPEDLELAKKILLRQ